VFAEVTFACINGMFTRSTQRNQRVAADARLWQKRWLDWDRHILHNPVCARHREAAPVFGYASANRFNQGELRAD
jgi:hypothetical protein